MDVVTPGFTQWSIWERKKSNLIPHDMHINKYILVCVILCVRERWCHPFTHLSTEPAATQVWLISGPAMRTEMVSWEGGGRGGEGDRRVMASPAFALSLWGRDHWCAVAGEREREREMGGRVALCHLGCTVNVYIKLGKPLWGPCAFGSAHA